VPFLFALSVTLRELGQLAFSPRRDVTGLSNYVELVLVALTWLICFDNANLIPVGAVGALVILLSVMELIFLAGSLPIFPISTFMIMLKKVTITFLKIFCLYS
jgi:hypothetical protein